MQFSRFGKIETVKAKNFVDIFWNREICSKTDGAGHYFAAVVINVLPDQIDPAGTKKNMIWFFVKEFFEPGSHRVFF